MCFHLPYKWPSVALVQVDKYCWNVLTDQRFHKPDWVTSVRWFLIFLLEDSGKAEETRRAEEKTFRGCCSAEWKKRWWVRWWKHAGDLSVLVGSASDRLAFSACRLWLQWEQRWWFCLGFFRNGGGAWVGGGLEIVLFSVLKEIWNFSNDGASGGAGWLGIQIDLILAGG